MKERGREGSKGEREEKRPTQVRRELVLGVWTKTTVNVIFNDKTLESFL